MDIYLNILVIIFAVIVFLLIYYITLQNDQKAKNYRPPLNNYGFEAGEEMGVDEMYEDLKKEEKSEYQEKEYNYPYLGEKYHQDFIRLITRDPGHLFTYWEINNEEFFRHQPALRLIEEDFDKHIDIVINHQATSWYLNSQSNISYSVIIGYFKNGVFHSLARSNKVKTPPDKPSHIIDEHWMTIEELSAYSIRVEMDTLSMIKSIEGRKKAAELNIDSYSFSRS
ncbi:MAG TPA: DUF4912 domain-containing protein [Halanaerobiales bacterium]|nr:DUF4912 domain-containing protein [Halanaerobiales bacterium]